MRRFFIVLIIAILLFFSYFLVNLTGFAINNDTIEVSIGEKLNGKLTALSYPSGLWLGQIVDIAAEFQNTGSVNLTTNIEIRVYRYHDNKLNLSATYYDFSKKIVPGSQRIYRVIYFPYADGPYYIQARAPYDGKISELWGAFYVYPLNWTPPIYDCPTQCVYNGYTYGACRQECQLEETENAGICSNPLYPKCCCGGYNLTTISTSTIEGNVTTSSTPFTVPTTATTSVATTSVLTTTSTIGLTTSTIGIPKIEIEYPEEIEIYPGESKFVNIIVNNTGEVSFTRLRLYLSTTRLINTTINPKVVFDLPVGESVIFLVTLDAPSTIPPGEYPFDFELISKEIKAEKSSLIKVLSEEISLKDLVYRTILNYKLLITQIDNEIISMHMKRYDVRLANQSITYAKANLTYAEELYDLEGYEDAWNTLKDVKKNIEDAVFHLGHATLQIRAEPTIFLIIILILPILVTIIFVTYYMLKKKETERPRLLRNIKQ